jgi:hypothetical protein
VTRACETGTCESYLPLAIESSTSNLTPVEVQGSKTVF